ncbi:hypothetical protein L484_019574 [Morus notabilis]|uniref:Uncharacterized protein n=1 Tax=Morus notabilis TaxID=981085 RepID=W9RVT1_9ROSA|nr:uncharacterized protein LOC21402513 [Morus notabilis]EXC13617.1 hypothetical protein L484_019574 [Morus notabilis]
MLLARRQSSRFVRFLFSLSPRRFAEDMAATSAASVISRGFHVESPSSSSSSSSSVRFCAFAVRGCFESDPHNRHPRLSSLHTNGKASNGGRRSSGFDHHKAQFVRDLELEGISPLQDVRTADARSLAPNGCDMAFQRGNVIGFPNHSLPRDKIAVAVDVDEVLGNFVSALNRFIADRYSLNHSVSEYHVYEFFKIWNCSRDEADIRVHEFFKTSYFKTGIHPIPGAQKALHKLSRFCNLSVVTSRQNAIKDHTIEWIEKHYPGLFQEIHFGNHFALDGVSRPKSDICRSLGAKVLIDDNPRYAIECADAGIRVLLFDYENSYPWCKTDSINENPLVTKVHNWEEVEQQLNTLVFH